MIRNVTITTVLVITLFLQTSGICSALEPKKAQPKDKCPVCGMFVAPYPKWSAQIVFNDGTYAIFDGPKDMMKYYFDMSRYVKGKSTRDIGGIFVTEYYSTRMMPARDVWFVLGSDVMGPMGAELIPVKGKPEANTFMRDHAGKRMVRFSEVTSKDIP